MSSFIHLSDLHINSNDLSDENVALKKVVSCIIDKYSSEKPAILITGDLVDDGLESQYMNARNILKPLVNEGFTILPAPGNHDYGLKGNVYTEAAQNRFQQFIMRDLLNIPAADTSENIMEDIYPFVYEDDEAVYYGIDTVVAAEDDFMHLAAGEVGQIQLEKFQNLLAAASGEKTKIAYMHHHPFSRLIGFRMKDAQKVMEVMAEKIDILCFGHKHVPEIWLDRDEIKWIIAADKTTRLQRTMTFDFIHIEILDKNRFVISKVRA